MSDYTEEEHDVVELKHSLTLVGKGFNNLDPEEMGCIRANYTPEKLMDMLNNQWGNCHIAIVINQEFVIQYGPYSWAEIYPFL